MRDFELLHDVDITAEDNLIQFDLIAKAKPFNFDEGVTDENRFRAMKEEIASVEKNQNWDWLILVTKDLLL